MDDTTPEPQPGMPTAEPAADTTPQPVTEPAIAATPEPITIGEPRTRRFTTPVAGGVIAGVIGLGLGAGVVALANGGDDHHGSDRRMTDQQVQAQPAQNQPAQHQPARQGGMMPGRRGDRPGQSGQQGQQGQGGFFPPNGGGQPQGRSGGS